MSNADKYLDSPYDAETLEEEAETVVDSRIMSGKELNALLPQVFTRSGTIRKDTRRSLRGLDEMVTAVKLAERCRNEDASRSLGTIQIQLPAGHIGLCDAIADHIRATDLFVALAAKGWYISSK